MTLPSVAYLTGEYPRATDTWIQREVASLRELGVSIDTFAVRRPDDEQMVGPEQRAELEGSTYLYEQLRSPRLVSAHLGLLVRSPRRYLRGLRLMASTRRPGPGGFAYQLVYFLEAGLLASAVRRRGLDHIHNHFGDSSCTVAMLAAEVGGFSFSFTLHGPGIFFEPYTWRLDEKLARAAFCSCISYFCRSQAAIFANPGDQDRLHIVHCGVRPDDLSTVEHQGLGRELLFVARLAEVKGVPVLLEAMALVAKTHPDAHLTIVGDGPERARFEQVAHQLGVDGKVTFAGYQAQAEVSARLAEADVFVLPSYAEGVPVTLMEAMGSALPVVATQVGGVSELVEEGVSGYIVRPGDPDALAGRLIALLGDHRLRQRFGDAGQAKVEAEFSNLTEAARLLTLFTNTVAGLPSSVRPQVGATRTDGWLDR
ncbi:MAG: glycosyltransferase family 4 protein [Actinomycetia bacterium]|nr:glycosyltransferase family 4 protein [Actinomycetes bacterium]